MWGKKKQNKTKIAEWAFPFLILLWRSTKTGTFALVQNSTMNQLSNCCLLFAARSGTTIWHIFIYSQQTWAGARINFEQIFLKHMFVLCFVWSDKLPLLRFATYKSRFINSSHSLFIQNFALLFWQKLGKHSYFIYCHRWINDWITKDHLWKFLSEDRTS